MAEDNNPNRLQDEFLQNAVDSGTEVRVFLTNAVRLVGKVTDFDKFCFLLDKKDGSGKPMLVYKHSISSIVPGVENEN